MLTQVIPKPHLLYLVVQIVILNMMIVFTVVVVKLIVEIYGLVVINGVPLIAKATETTKFFVCMVVVWDANFVFKVIASS